MPAPTCFSILTLLRLLHTADWQLGMTRHFLAGEAQARYAADRLDAVRAILRLASDERCEAVVVSGDVFETNHVDRRTVAQAIDVLGTSRVPVFLLPGNHDPLDAASVYRSRAFVVGKPEHVVVLDSTEPRRLASGAEIVGAPWSSKRPLSDLVADASRALEPTDSPRVLVGHGVVDAIVAVGRENPALISLAAAERALAERRYHYLALGDRHSPTRIGTSDRVWYAGSQEVTDFDEIDPGRALVVEVGPASCTVTPHRVGRWTFVRKQFELVADGDLEALRQWLQSLDDKPRIVAKLGFRGTLTLRQRVRLDEILDEAHQLLAAISEWERASEIAIRPDADDLAGVEFSGFALRAAERLREVAATGGEASESARGALALLFRLAQRIP